MKKAEHEITHYPSSRIGTIDLGKIGLDKHHVAGLLEIDVTKALESIKKSGRKEDIFYIVDSEIHQHGAI